MQEGIFGFFFSILLPASNCIESLNYFLVSFLADDILQMTSSEFSPSSFNFGPGTLCHLPIVENIIKTISPINNKNMTI